MVSFFFFSEKRRMFLNPLKIKGIMVALYIKLVVMVSFFLSRVVLILNNYQDQPRFDYNKVYLF